MSSDTAKENASVDDSSVTEWKLDMENLDDPESSSEKANEEFYSYGVEEHGHRLGNSGASKEGKLYGTRYFIIKSLNHQNIQLSIEKGIWATQVMNEPILDEAFHELPEDIGEALCELLDGNIDVDHKLKRNEFSGDDLSSKRPRIEPSHPLQDDEYSVPPVHMTWARTPMLHPSLLYQQQAEASKLHFAHPGSPGVYLPENLAVTSRPSKITRMKRSRVNGNLANVKVDQDMSSRFDVCGLSGERSPLSTLTEDDFLEMSYEEYLEAHSKSNIQLCHMAAGQSRTMREPLRSKENDDDLHSHFCDDRRRSHRSHHHSPYK